MRAVAVLIAVCLGLAASAPAEEVVLVPVEVVEAVKVSMSKGFFEDLSQISQNIIAHAHKLAEQIISNIEEAAKKALTSLQNDRPAILPVQPVVQPEVMPAGEAVVAAPANSDIAVDVFKRKEEMAKPVA